MRVPIVLCCPDLCPSIEESRYGVSILELQLHIPLKHTGEEFGVWR